MRNRIERQAAIDGAKLHGLFRHAVDDCRFLQELLQTQRRLGDDLQRTGGELLADPEVRKAYLGGH